MIAPLLSEHFKQHHVFGNIHNIFTFSGGWTKMRDYFLLFALVIVFVRLFSSHSFATIDENNFGQPVLVASPAAPNAIQSDSFEVSVNEQPVFVEADRRISHAQFQFAGEIEVVVQVNFVEEVESFTLSPESYGVAATAVGNRITFRLDRPRKLILHEINGSQADFILEKRLFIFADALLPNSSDITGQVLTSSTLPIDNSGTTDVTAAIQVALDSLSNSGGGTLILEDGLYLTQSIFMRDNVTLWVEHGARIQASDIPSLEDGMIKFFDVENSHLTGPGSIDANGVFLRYELGKTWSVIRADRSTSCSISDIRLFEPSLFAVFVRDCEDWRMANTKQIDYANRDLESNGGEDGIDPDACRQFLVEDCFVYAGDDAVAIKAVTPMFPFVEDITFRNNVIFNSALGSGLGIGSQLEQSHLRNITFENNDVVAARFALDVAMRETTSAPGDTPILEDISFRGNRFGKTRGSFLFGATARRNAIFQDFTLEHLSFGPNQDGNPPRLQTFDNSIIRNWLFDTVVVEGETINGDSFGELGDGVSGLIFQSTEAQIVSVRSEDSWVPENGGVGRFIIHRSGNLDNELVVSFSLSGSAEQGVDFELVQESCTLETGQSESEVEILPLSNDDPVSVESVVLRLTNDHESDYIIGPNYIATIAIDEREILLGDVNRDSQVNLLDVQPFVAVLSANLFQVEADTNEDGNVNLLDVGPFIQLLLGS